MSDAQDNEQDGAQNGAPDDPRKRRLGDYIRMQRQLADLSLRRMADLTQVSNAYLSQIERGLHQPSLRVLQSIAEALNVSADTLLTEAGLMDGATRSGAGASVDTESAIRSDPALSPADRETLIRVYRGLRKDTEHTD